MLVFSLLIGIILFYIVPVVGAVVLMRRKKGAGRAFLFGILAFSVSQLLMRVPILTVVLPRFAWFGVLQLSPWAYGIFLGLTAGLFEEIARWIAIHFFLKGRTDFEHGLAFGLGHGGIENMALIGPNYIATLITVLAGQGALLGDIGGASVFISVGERLYAVAFHVGASLLVMNGIRKGRALLYLLAAVVLHTVMDAAVVILPTVFGAGVAGVEIWGAVVGILTLLLGVLCYRGKGGKLEGLAD